LQSALDTLKQSDNGAPSGTKLYSLPFSVVAITVENFECAIVGDVQKQKYSLCLSYTVMTNNVSDYKN